MSHAPTFPIEGMFHMMSLSGTYLNSYCGNVPPPFITNHVFSSFFICLSRGGGIGVTNKIVDGVLIVVALLKKPQFCRLTTLI
jgi:hypothetical protein